MRRPQKSDRPLPREAGGKRRRKAGHAADRIVVIGAGAVGAACAAELSRRGRRVQVLSHPFRSTTAVSGGHLLLQSKQPGRTLDLAMRSLELLATFAAGREEELGYRRIGSLIAAVTREEAAALQRHSELLKSAGVPVQWLGPQSARELEPELSPDLVGASFCPLDGQVDPRALAGAWLQEAIAHGAVLTSGVLVESFVRRGNALAGVIAGGVEFPASAVVLAGGPWSGELSAMAGAPIEILPRRGVLLRARSPRRLASRPLLGGSYLETKFFEEPSGIAFSFQQHPDGECLLGGSRELTGFSGAGTSEIRDAIVARGCRYLPALGAVEWGLAEVGFRPWAPGGGPHIGPGNVPGLFLATGHEGDGIGLAAVTAELVAADVDRYLEVRPAGRRR